MACLIKCVIPGTPAFGVLMLLLYPVFRVLATYKGKASHAAGFPWEGVNALDAAVMAYNNVSCLRQQMKPDWRVHGKTLQISHSMHQTSPLCNLQLEFC